MVSFTIAIPEFDLLAGIAVAEKLKILWDLFTVEF
jgi:hypothetical protein